MTPILSHCQSVGQRLPLLHNLSPIPGERDALRRGFGTGEAVAPVARNRWRYFLTEAS